MSGEVALSEVGSILDGLLDSGEERVELAGRLVQRSEGQVANLSNAILAPELVAFRREFSIRVDYHALAMRAAK